MQVRQASQSVHRWRLTERGAKVGTACRLVLRDLTEHSRSGSVVIILQQARADIRARQTAHRLVSLQTIGDVVVEAQLCLPQLLLHLF